MKNSLPLLAAIASLGLLAAAAPAFAGSGYAVGGIVAASGSYGIGAGGSETTGAEASGGGQTQYGGNNSIVSHSYDVSTTEGNSAFGENSSQTYGKSTSVGGTSVYSTNNGEGAGNYGGSATSTTYGAYDANEAAAIAVYGEDYHQGW